MSGLKSAWELSLERSEKLVPELKNKKKLPKNKRKKLAIFELSIRLKLQIKM